ncbi:MAG: DUF6572 domain-containing protein [Chthoniobacterales bacterium]
MPHPELERSTADTAQLRGIEHPGVIDLFAVAPATDEVVLVMYETRESDDSDERLHELEEKFNAYASFLLDGEMHAEHPEVVGKRARIELRCDHMPGERALGLLNAIHDQLALQAVRMEVVVAAPGGYGARCSCHNP